MLPLLPLRMARGAEAETGKDAPASDWPAVRAATFAMVWETVNETYFDPAFGGVNWPDVREKFRPKIEAAADNAQLRPLLQTMLDELRRTHFAILPRETAVFTPAERDRIGTTGAEFVAVGGEVVVAEVKAGSPAAEASVKSGDVIRKVGGQELSRLGAWLAQSGQTPARTACYLAGYVKSWLQAGVGTKVKVTLAGADGVERDVELTCAPHTGAWSEPIGSFPAEPIRLEARRGDDGIATLRFNVFSPPLMKEIRGFLRSLRPGDGLVIDLRGNSGGMTVMASGLCGWLTAREFSLGRMTMRRGFMSFAVFPQERAFAGPVAVLIDSGSASTSEILAAGLQEAKRARVFGENSGGAALPSSFKSLPTGDLFQFAIADMKTPGGKLLEGEGVTPDEAVVRTRADLAAGRDPVWEAARAWLDGERQARPAASASLGAANPQAQRP